MKHFCLMCSRAHRCTKSENIVPEKSFIGDLILLRYSNTLLCFCSECGEILEGLLELEEGLTLLTLCSATCDLTVSFGEDDGSAVWRSSLELNGHLLGNRRNLLLLFLMMQQLNIAGAVRKVRYGVYVLWVWPLMDG